MRRRDERAKKGGCGRRPPQAGEETGGAPRGAKGKDEGRDGREGEEGVDADGIVEAEGRR